MESGGAVTRMSLCVLGSGSSGNCSALIQHDARGRRRVTLIDLGLSPRQTNARLQLVGLSLADVDDALITHFDRDHFYSSWMKKGRELGLTLRFHRRHLNWAERSGATRVRSEPFTDEPFELGACRVAPVRFDHDHLGTTGFRIESSAGGAIGFATDLGRVPETLARDFAGVNVLAIESNYCPVMQRESGRPYFLQRRITGGAGHLSNEETCEFVLRLDGACGGLDRIVLLHLSRQCNAPERALSHYQRSPELAKRIVVTDQSTPSEWVHVDSATRPPHPAVEIARAAAPFVPTLWDGVQRSAPSLS